MGEKPIVIEIPPVEEWSLKDLKSVCKHRKIKGYSKMSRDELVRIVDEVLDNMKPIEA